MSVQLSCAKSNYQKSSSIEKENLKIGRYCYSVHTALGTVRIKLLLLAFHVRSTASSWRQIWSHHKG